MNMATKAQVKKCIETIAPLAQAQFAAGKKILPSVCIAQACCESAYLTSQKMLKANAVFGIKVGKSKVHFGTAWKDNAYSTATKECYDGKTYTNITDMFRAYDSIADSVEDYYDMMVNCTRYKGAVGETDYTKAITAIKNAGYATDPNYVSTIVSIIKTNNLTQYDSGAASTTASASTSTVASTKAPFTVGKTYTLQGNMYVRKTANGTKKKYTELTTNAKSNAVKQSDGSAVLKKGTVVTCKGVEQVDGAWWVKIPSGYVCGVGTSGTVYLK
jgi:hypothetical protein